jgi:phage terminase large subunit-like protein
VPRNSLQELLEIQAELERRSNENLAETFVPNSKGEEFIKMVGNNESFINMFCAANGVGKSATCAMITRAICFGPVDHDTTRSRWKEEWGEAPDSFFDYPLYKDFPYLKKGRIISDPTTIKEKIVPELKLWFPANRFDIHYDTRKEGKQFEAKWMTDTGFEFDLMTTEQNAKEFESTDLGFLYFDEPAPNDIYLASIARCRRGAIVYWGFTPLKYSAWIKDDLYDKRDGKTIDYVTADVWENCEEREGTRGILKEIDIDRMISQYPEVEFEARVNGKFGHLLGLVHKKFEPKIHVIEPFDIDENDFCVAMALDTHSRVPDALLWMAIDEKGRKYIIDELMFTGTDKEVAAKIMKKEEDGHMRIIDRLIDPSAFNDDKRTNEKSYADRLEGHGLRFKRGSKKLHECIRRTDSALKYELKEGKLVVEPEFYIFSNCQGLIKELLHYVWDEYQGKSKDKKDPNPNPVDKDDHLIEDLHRLLMEDYYFRPRGKQRSVRSIRNKTLNLRTPKC